MPKSLPLPDWSGSDVFIIGGGPSLSHFDFDLLWGRCTIGCNQAFRLGGDICQICAFGDNDFWEAFEVELQTFGGWVATNYPVPLKPPWLAVYGRQDDGLAVGPTLAWNANTGALAANLALSLGAARVYLLGMDMDSQGKRTHWHDRPIQPQNQDHYHKFQGGFAQVAQAIPHVFPGRQIFNVTDGSSKLRAFPQVTFDSVFGKELSCSLT